MQPLMLHLKIGSWTILQNTEGPSLQNLSRQHRKKICNLWKKWQIMTFFFCNKWTSNCIIVIDSLVCKLYSENLHFWQVLADIKEIFSEFMWKSQARTGRWIKRDKLQKYINLFWGNVYTIVVIKSNLFCHPCNDQLISNYRLIWKVKI